MKKLNRRRFLETAGAVGAAAVWGLTPALAQRLVTVSSSRREAGPFVQDILQGLADYIDAHHEPAALLDGDFCVVRTSRPHQLLLNYDPEDVYGKSCETYWSREMHRIIKGIGGLHSFRRLGIYCVDFTLVRRRAAARLGSVRPVVSVGRTVAIGDPYAPMAYLTTSRLADSPAARSAATVLCLKAPA